MRELRELNILQRLSHPNIINLFGHSLITDENTGAMHLYICMEYMAGGSLHDVVKQFGAFGPTMLSYYTREILHGLVYLHEHG